MADIRQVVAGANIQFTENAVAQTLTFDVTGVQGELANYAALRTYAGSATAIYVVAAVTAFDGGAGIFRYDSTDLTSTDNSATTIVDGQGRRWKREVAQFVNAQWFGAKCDASATDTTAIQAAVDYCLTFTRPKDLLIPGRTLLGASININRSVDTAISDFRIVGLGECGGFLVNSNIKMFDSSIAMPGVDPVSEFVTFRNIQFEATTNSLSTAYVLSQKFLRMSFDNCHFQRIKCADYSVGYAQTFRFNHCNMRFWTGYFFNTAGSFDMDFSGNIAEFGGSFFRTHDPAAGKGSVGNRLRGNLFEGSTGGFVEASIVRGLFLGGNYTEGNSGRFLNTFVSGAVNYGITMQGNLMIATAANLADTTYFECQWGNTLGATSMGNYSNGRLHDQGSMTTTGLITEGDRADLVLVKGNATGITDISRSAATGVWCGMDNKTFYVANATNWCGIDAGFTAFVSTPAVTSGATLVPMRFMFGAFDPSANPGFYGNPFWAVGSRVTNSSPAVGSPKGWLCTVSGTPGTWVSEGNL